MRFGLVLALSALPLTFAANARAYCRTTTCTPPGSFVPTAGHCEPDGLTSCTMNGATVKDVPLWWKNACVGYSLQKDASKYATLDQATQAVASAFGAWESAECGSNPPSIAAKDLGPVVCGDAAFNVDGPNQHVIVFRDSAWPYKTQEEIQFNLPSPTIALTTVSFNRDTGEILDADIELNTADHQLTFTDTPTSGVYDLQSVLTHEAGHFLGLAHTPVSSAVMFYEDEGGSSRHRSLSTDDAQGICAVYPPTGIRPVDVVASPTGGVAASACDPTPRGGQSSACVTSSPPPPTSSGCATSSAETRGALPFAVLAGAAVLARRRRARGRMGVSSRA